MPGSKYLEQDRLAGRKIAAVDYETYAAGEAALGWLNASARLRAEKPVEWGVFVKDLLEGVRADLRAASAEIAHLKLYLTADSGHIVGNLTGNDAAPFLRGGIDAACREVAILINARVHCRPDQLRTVMETRLLSIAGGHRIEVMITDTRSFFPGRPQPTHRYEAIV